MRVHCCEDSAEGGMLESGCGDGCFSWRASKVASFIGAIGASVSSEQANLTAPLKSPSSSFADTRAARIVVGSSAGRKRFLVVDPLHPSAGC